MPPEAAGAPQGVSCLPHPVFFGAPAPHSPHQEGDNTLPDFTLPLVDMAEMDKPVMVVTVTDIRMMSHVRAAGRGHCFVPASPPAP